MENHFDLVYRKMSNKVDDTFRESSRVITRGNTPVSVKKRRAKPEDAS